MKTDTSDTAPVEPPIEIYGETRIAEFDAAEAELAEVLRHKKTGA